MTTTIRNLWAAELTKLATTRSAPWLFASAALLAALPVSGVIASGGVAQDALATAAGMRTVLEHGGMASILPLILGVLISTSEYRHGTVVDTFLTEPRRIRVIIAKLLTGGVVGVVAGAAVTISTAVTVSVWYAAKDVPLDLSASPALGSLIGIGLWTTLYTLIGVAVGALVRGQAVAIVSAVVWIFVAETAFAGLIVSLGKWLPATAARALGNAPETGLLTQTGGGLVLLGWATVFTVGAMVVTTRRDVT